MSSRGSMSTMSILDLNSNSSVASFHTNIICAECGETVEILTKTHIAKHGLTQKEYLHRHPHHCYLHMWPDLPNFKAIDSMCIAIFDRFVISIVKKRSFEISTPGMIVTPL